MEWCGYNWTNKMEGGRIMHPTYPWYWYSHDTIKVDKNDVLELSVRENPRDVKYWDGKVYHLPYEVSTMRSIEDFSYGIFSAEIKVPKGKNLSASFWLTGSRNWPPEIDIMEGLLDNTGNWFKCFESHFPWIKLGWSTTTNIHYRDEMLNRANVKSRNIPYIKQPFEPDEWFVEYKCKWEPDRITFYANDKIVRKVTGFECKQLTKNIIDQEKGFKMNVVFNVWVENPDIRKPEITQPMFIRNFKYTEL